MTALYRGETVRVVRVETHRAYVVWRGKIKRVNKSDLVTTPDMAIPPTAGQVLEHQP